MPTNLQLNMIEYVLSVFYSNSELLLLTCLLIAFVVYYVYGVAKQPLLVCQEGKFKSFLLDSCPILHNRYWPTFWCFGTHAQTALANILRGRLPDLPYQREIIKMKDGGIISLDWLECPEFNSQKHKAVVLFMPGLTGHSQTEYIKSLVPIAQKVGCRAVVFNNRGRGGVDILSPRTYSACNTEDLREVLGYIKERYPDRPIYGVGISLGGIILGHYLAESRSDSLVCAALLISTAFDIHAGEASLSIPGLNLMLNKHLTQRLLEMLEPHKEKFENANVDMNYVFESKTIRDFDERFTAKIFNYKNVEEYYTAATLRSKIQQVQVPLLCVNAADDMFCPISAIPCQEVLSTNNIAIVISSRGGHIGFMDGFLPATPFFSERLFEQYLRGLLSLPLNQKNKCLYVT
ncbi:phospholipase ABHD3-like [Uloborus diversus]|uniref:phospholipase ABHD3-like n=1 Tax=Uloborus diversus TaxID=327109 RepID=UPI002409F456|nr:phospholipase ABHD3-like [Uloborus diversus]